ncbi:hypothetical protein CCS92_34635, partial [Methylobacterium radiotolerans]
DDAVRLETDRDGSFRVQLNQRKPDTEAGVWNAVDHHLDEPPQIAGAGAVCIPHDRSLGVEDRGRDDSAGRLSSVNRVQANRQRVGAGRGRGGGRAGPAGG